MHKRAQIKFRHSFLLFSRTYWMLGDQIWTRKLVFKSFVEHFLIYLNLNKLMINKKMHGNLEITFKCCIFTDMCFSSNNT